MSPGRTDAWCIPKFDSASQSLWSVAPQLIGFAFSEVALERIDAARSSVGMFAGRPRWLRRPHQCQALALHRREAMAGVRSAEAKWYHAGMGTPRSFDVNGMNPVRECVTLYRSVRVMATRPTLLTVLHDRIVAKHYSARTEEAYRHWVRQFVRHFQMRHPRDLGPGDVQAFLTHLARDAGVSASTQNQALAALLFLYREVLRLPMSASIGHMHAKRPRGLPNVLSHTDVMRVPAPRQKRPVARIG